MLRMEVFGDEGLKYPDDNTVIFPETDFLRIQDMLSTMSIPAVWTGKGPFTLSVNVCVYVLENNRRRGNKTQMQ